MKSVKVSNSLVPAGTNFPTTDPVLIRISEGEQWIYVCSILGMKTQRKLEPSGVAVLDNFVMAPDQKAIALTAMQFAAVEENVIAEALPFHASVSKILKIILRTMKGSLPGALLFLVLDARANKVLIERTRKALALNAETEEGEMHNPLVFEEPKS